MSHAEIDHDLSWNFANLMYGMWSTECIMGGLVVDVCIATFSLEAETGAEWRRAA